MAAGSSSKGKKKTNTKKGNTAKNRKKGVNPVLAFIGGDDLLVDVLVTILAGLIIMMLLSLIGKCGLVGKTLRSLMFGLLGFSAWFFPFFLIYILIFAFHEKGKKFRNVRMLASCVLFLLYGVLCEIHAGTARGLKEYDADFLYKAGMSRMKGGGLIGGSIAWGLLHVLNTAGTLLVLLIIAAICLIAITRKSPIALVGRGVNDTMEAGRNIMARERARREALREEEEEEEEEEPVIPGPVVTDYRDPSPARERKDRTDRARERVPGRNKREMDLNDTDLGSDPGPVPSAGDFLETEKTSSPANDAAAVVTAARSLGNRTEEEVPAPSPEKTASQIYSDSDLNAITVHRAKEGGQPSAAQGRAPARKKQYTFPPYDLLERPAREKDAITNKELQETGKELERVLQDFKVDVTVTAICRGPSVTRFEVRPGPHITVNAISAREKDIALNLGAKSIRMEAPIPGRRAVGIEVPNEVVTVVKLREILESAEFVNARSKISFVVGKDITGRNVISDIGEMPHLLVAGSTGSGKSVFLNALIVSLLYKASPSEVKFIMIDPKMVELSIYDGIPHLLLPVVTQPKKAAAALQWACAEMDNRYSRFVEAGVRGISSYNHLVKEKKKEGTPDPELEYMPRIVIIVDELAELMATCSKEVETTISRLTAKARAAGIHLVVATQRPSVDVITGVIKANMPSRIAFMTSSAVDSKTILDHGGAEKLLGKGDMLFMTAKLGKAIRVQGAFLSDDDAIKVVEYIKKKNPVSQDSGRKSEQIQKEMDALETASDAGGKTAPAEGSRDPLFEKAGRFVVSSQKATIGRLQRELQVGFNRAARIMDQLADEGIVSSENGTKARKVLMTQSQFEDLLNNMSDT